MSNPHSEAAKHGIIGSCLQLLQKKLVQALVQFCSSVNSKNLQELKSIATEQNTAFLTTTAFIVTPPAISSRFVIL